MKKRKPYRYTTTRRRAEAPVHGLRRVDDGYMPEVAFGREMLAKLRPNGRQGG